MKTTCKTLFLVLGAFGVSSSSLFALERNPSAACKFEIKSVVVRSESAVQDFDEASDKLVQVFPELTEFSEMIPNSVALKISYDVQGCREPLVARVRVLPLVGNGAINFEDEATVEAQISTARQKAKPGKPWVQRDAKVQKLKDSGEIVIQEIPLLKYFEALSKNTWAWTVKFEVSVHEDGREVATKEVSLDTDMHD